MEQKYNVNVLAVKCDLKIENDIKNLVELTIKKFKSIDILINNSGAMSPITFTDIE